MYFLEKLNKIYNKTLHELEVGFPSLVTNLTRLPDFGLSTPSVHFTIRPDTKSEQILISSTTLTSST